MIDPKLTAFLIHLPKKLKVIERLAVSHKESAEAALHKLDDEAADCLRDTFAQLEKGEMLEGADLFSGIANIHRMIGDLTAEIKYYNKAALRHQYAMKLADSAEGALASKVRKIKTTSLTELDHIHNKMLEKASLIAAQEHIPIEDSGIGIEFTNRNLVEIARTSLNDELPIIAAKSSLKDKSEYITYTKAMSGNIVSGMKLYLSGLIQKVEQTLGPPPCRYSVVGLGSIALGTMTPYSDLEFAIITANDSYKSSPDTRISNYFRNLSHLVHFRVICLSETVIPASEYPGVNLDAICPAGIMFDLGGKTSLGRVGKDYDLIGTKDCLLDYVRNSFGSVSRIDKNLPAILERATHIYGDERLYSSYQTEVDKFLADIAEWMPEFDMHELPSKAVFIDVKPSAPAGTLNAEARALKILYEGIVENIPGQEPIRREGNLTQFAPKPIEQMGKLFNVKQEIYRLPDRMVYNLGMIFGVNASNPWDVIDKLVAKGVLRQDSGENIKSAVTFAIHLRNRTYSHYSSQDDKMDFATSESDSIETQLKEKFRLSEEELKYDGALFKFYYVVIPFFKRLELYCEQFRHLSSEEKAVFFKDEAISENSFYSDTPKVRGDVNIRLMRFCEALRCFELEEKTLEESGDATKVTDIAHNCQMLSLTHKLLGNYPAFLEYSKKRLSILENKYGKEALHTFASRNDIAEAYCENREFKVALQYNLRTITLWEENFGSNIHIDIAVTLSNTGRIYQALGKHGDAIKYYEKAFKMLEELHKGAAHPYIAIVLDNMGTAHTALANYKDALSCSKKSLSILEAVYEGKPHPEMAACLDNIGKICEAQCKYKMAIEYYMKALRIEEEINFGINHPKIAVTLNNIAVVYRAMGKLEEAEAYHARSLKMRKELYADEAHPAIADSLNNIARLYTDQGKYKKALKYFLELLPIQEKIHEGKNHPQLAIALNNLGAAYEALKKYDEALKYHERALAMRKELYHDSPHPYTASSLGNIACVHQGLGNYKLALEYHYQALDIQLKVHLDRAHSDTATVIGNIAQAYLELEDYTNALKYYQQALYMREIVFSGKPHIDIYTNIEAIADIYKKQGLYEKALEKKVEEGMMVAELEGTSSKRYKLYQNSYAQISSDVEYFQKATSLLGSAKEKIESSKLLLSIKPQKLKSEKRGALKTAKQELEKALQYFEFLAIKSKIKETLEALSKAYIVSKDTSKAEYIALKSRIEKADEAESQRLQTLADIEPFKIEHSFDFLDHAEAEASEIPLFLAGNLDELFAQFS